MFNLYSERMNRNFGTARLNPKSKSSKDKSTIRKLPPITCFAMETSKEKQWANIAACHEGSNIVTTWSYDRCCMGEHIIHQPSFEKHSVSSTCVALSSCGNFLVIGFSNGLIFKYNIQSGIFRQYYENQSLSEHRAHDGIVSSISIDALDILLVSSGHDKFLRLWNFKKGVLVSEIEFGSPIMNSQLHKENNLMAVTLNDNSIELFDLETRTVIRRFSGPAPVVDLTFSPDSCWLVVAYEDNSIRTWDLSLGKMIDAFKVSTRCTSIAMSSTGEFLATAHEGSLGINIWCNFTIYCPTPLRSLKDDFEPIVLDLPFVLSDEQVDQSEEKESDDKALPEKAADLKTTHYVSPDQLYEDLLTLSGLPSSRWKNLLNIDELRKKKLIEQEEERRKNRPVKVPFFIPVRDGLNPTLDVETVKSLNEKTVGSESVPTKIQELRMLSPLAKTLMECSQEKNYDRFFAQLKDLGPSATDFEIRSIDKETCGSIQPMICFLEAMQSNLDKRLDYELTSSWLALFLKAHSDVISTDEDAKQYSRELLEPVELNWNRLRGEFNKIFCVLNFIRSSII